MDEPRLNTIEALIENATGQEESVVNQRISSLAAIALVVVVYVAFNVLSNLHGRFLGVLGALSIGAVLLLGITIGSRR